MNTAWWVAQIIAAFAFGGAGYVHWIAFEKSSQNPGMVWMRALPSRMVRTIGFLEILGSVGLVVPAATGIAPWLTPLAAFLLGVVMVLAMGFHLRRGEYPNIAFNLILAVLAFAVAYGRAVASPF
jgi:uncharacterized membrane protein